MIYDAFAHLPIYGLEDLGFVPRGEAREAFIGRTHHRPPGGQNCRYKHQMGRRAFSLHAFRHVRHVRPCRRGVRPDARPNRPPPQIPGAKISVCHGVGGMFAASGTIIMFERAAQRKKPAMESICPYLLFFGVFRSTAAQTVTRQGE